MTKLEEQYVMTGILNEDTHILILQYIILIYQHLTEVWMKNSLIGNTLDCIK